MSEGSLDHRLFETIKNRSEIAAARKGRGVKARYRSREGLACRAVVKGVYHLHALQGRQICVKNSVPPLARYAKPVEKLVVHECKTQDGG